MRYQIVKPMNGYQTGDVLTDSDFVNQRRVTLLIEQRYIQPIADEQSAPAEGITERVTMVVPKAVTVKRGRGRK